LDQREPIYDIAVPAGIMRAQKTDALGGVKTETRYVMFRPKLFPDRLGRRQQPFAVSGLPSLAQFRATLEHLEGRGHEPHFFTAFVFE